MKLSVLIPVYNRREALGRCLAALTRQTLPRREFEVVVGDDGSDDQPEALADAFRSSLDLRFVRTPHRNRAAALNAAFHASSGDVVFFTDSDMLPTPTLLERHRDFHRRDPRPHAALLGYMDWAPSLTPTRFMRYIVGPTAWQFGYGMRVDGERAPWGHFYGGNTSAKRAFVAASGLHDDSLSRAEDIELGYRLARAGMELVYDAAAVNYHDHHVTVGAFARRNRAVGRALVQIAQRHPELVVMLPLFEGAAFAREAERRGRTLEALVARAEAIDREAPVLPDETAVFKLYDLILWLSLGQGVREALHEGFAQSDTPATVIVPGGGTAAPIAPRIREQLAALERLGWEFLVLQTDSRPATRCGRLACYAAAAQARGRQLCFVQRDDLDAERVVALVEASAGEPRAGLVIQRTGRGRDAIAIPRPLFFECGGFAAEGRGDALGWRLAERVRALGYAPRELAPLAPAAATPSATAPPPAGAAGGA